VLASAGIALAWAMPLGARGEGVAGALPARVEVLDGRARVALPDGVLSLAAGAPGQRFPEALHFEQAPESRSRIGWSAAASLLVEGRTVLEWSPPDEAGMPLSWSFAEVDSASLEVRRGRVHIELAGGWRGALQPGAYTVRGLAGGSVEFRHAAGLPVTLWAPTADGAPLPPYTVLPGATVRLLAEARRPLALPGAADEIQEPHAKLGFESRTQAASFPSWGDFTWPWRAAAARETAPSSPQAAIEPVGGNLEPIAPEGARTEATDDSMHVDPRATPVLDPAQDGAAHAPSGAPALAGSTSTSRVGQEASEVPSKQTQAVDAPQSAATPEARVWRELRRKGRLMLSPYGPRWVEPVSAVPPPAPRRPNQLP
jgi:hypothetical protein